MDLHAIRQALADLLSAIPELRAYAYTPATPRPGPGGLAIIDEADDDQMVAYHQGSSLGMGLVTVYLKAIIIVAANNVEEAQTRLDDYRSLGTPKSIADALESMPSLNGAAQSVLVRGAGPTMDYDTSADGRRFWSVEFAIEVFA